MDNEYWHQKWQSNEIGFNQSQPNKLLQRYFPSLKLKSNSRIFVPLCGQSIDMLWLAGQGYQVVGVELSEVACNAFFKENRIPVKISEMNDFMLYKSDEVTIFVGDFFKLNQAFLGNFDAVYDRAALVALPEVMREAYSQKLIELMNLASAMLLITTSYNQNEMQGPPFSVDEKTVSALYSEQFDIDHLYGKECEIPLHLKTKGLLNATEHAFALTRRIT